MTRAIKTALLATLPMMSAGVLAAEPLSLSSNFRIGSSGVVCNAQGANLDPLLVGMFDRAYTVVCRDAAAAVGRLYALKGGKLPEARDIEPELVCDAPTAATLDGVAGATSSKCVLGESGIGYTVYSATARGRVYVAAGLSGYDSALQLGLRSLVLDRNLPGTVEVAVTEAGDAAAFARVQAGNLDPGEALAEGYVRNNEGSFAESAEFFETLVNRSREGGTGFDRTAEYLANQALQQSNLGNAEQSRRLFAEALAVADRADPLIVRLLRNFQAIDFLNAGAPENAVAVLDAPIPAAARPAALDAALRTGAIDQPLAQRLNIDDNEMVRLGGVSSRLTVPERVTLLDAQANYLRGAALRLAGRGAESRAALDRSRDGIASVRGGRIQSMRWLDAAILTERAVLDEASGDFEASRRSLENAAAIYGEAYPASAAFLAARGRLGAFLARRGDNDGAIAVFRDVVEKSAATPGAGLVTRRLLRPYFDALTADASLSGRNAADFFAAAQTLVRPGVAQTQAVLARELSGGSDEAAALFRQSVNLSREIVRTDARLQQLRAAAAEDSVAREAIAAEAIRRDSLGREQTALLAELAAFPKYRAVSPGQIGLSALQAQLKPGEAYFKMSLVGGGSYAAFVTRDGADVYRIDATPDQLAEMVRGVRETISTEVGGQLQTFAFDVALSSKLFETLLGPVKAKLPAVTHLIYEPDGALLTLPANLLVTDRAGVDAYLARTQSPTADQFDFTGIAWLGRDRMVTTAVSTQGFVENRGIAPSRATRPYLGVGTNAPASATRRASPRSDCEWPMQVWDAPIAPDELRLASSLLGRDRSTLVTGEGFTDTALAERQDLADYRVVHFATHGLVTAPAEDCPARPALVTSFGGPESDGLLSFSEIFDLRLDADTVILSACDTAGEATVEASREAGFATGGNFALDGLVRAFVGAGARTVVASHWPVPDDFAATERLMSEVFKAPQGTGLAEAMRQSQQKLMDDPETSHPYYWSGFAIIGDGARPLVGGTTQAASIAGGSRAAR